MLFGSADCVHGTEEVCDIVRPNTPSYRAVLSDSVATEGGERRGAICLPLVERVLIGSPTIVIHTFVRVVNLFRF